jgi:type IX secretion system PorP/SprF family membrane protein
MIRFEEMRKKITILIIGLLAATSSFAQVDPQFSQFYAAPLMVNPGYTGSIAEHRLIFNGRIQWPSLPQAYQTMAFSWDMWRPELRSGFGLQVLTDKAGSAGLRYTTARFNYSYKIIMNGWVLSPGLYFGYSLQSFDANKLLFGDQLDFGQGGLPGSQDPNVAKLNNVQFFDTGVGFLMYNSKTWFGASVYQLNEPNASLIDLESKWPMRINVHGGVRLPIYGDRYRTTMVSSLAPSFLYRYQGGTHQLDVGVQYMVAPVVVGLWYRGVPVMTSPNGGNSNEALIFSMGLIFDYFEFGYSYDFTISELSARTGGAHEISLQYEFGFAPRARQVKKKYQVLPCPTFNRKTNFGAGIFRRN